MVDYEEVETEEEEAGSGGLEMGLIIATTLALIAGIVVGLYELGTHYGAGPFKG